MAMTRIDLCFQGSINGAEVEWVHVTKTGEKLYVGDDEKLLGCRSQPTDEEVIENIKEGIWLVSLERSLDHNDSAEVELHNFELSK